MSSTCGACNQPCESEGNKSVIKCGGGCEKLFHLNCAKEEGDGRVLRSSQGLYKCKNCKNPSTHGSCSYEKADVLTKDFLVRVLDQFKDEVFKEMKSFKGDMNELSKSVQFVSDKLDETNKLMEDLKLQFAALKKENDKLRAENCTLKSDMSDMKNRVRCLEQYTRRNNIEISGVPMTKGENVADIVKDVGVALGLAVQDSEISAAHRIPSFKRERLPSIVVQFQSRSTKDNWIQKYKEVRPLSANEVNSNFSSQKVYINEHLSPENKLFLNKLKKKCSEIGYTYVWSRDGKFFVRKAHGEKSLRVDSFEEMNSLK